MKYVDYKTIKHDSRDIPDGIIFTVYRTESQQWAFAMRINGMFTVTRFSDQNVDEDGVRKVKNQILFAKHYGWSYLGQKAWNTEVDEMEYEFICMYCKSHAFDTSDPCPCRGKTKYDFLKKTPSGFILPF